MPAPPPRPPDPPAGEPPADGVFFWFCPACRRAERFGDADLVRFARDGWPRCCGRRVACLFADPDGD